MLRISLALGALTVMLSGCVTSYGQKFDVEAAPLIKVGVSKKADVQSRLGAPLSTTTEVSGDETWRWDYREATQAGFLTVLKVIDSTSDDRTLDVTFHNGIVSKCVLSTSKHTGSGYDGFIGVGTGSKATTNCSDLSQGDAQK